MGRPAATAKPPSLQKVSIVAKTQPVAGTSVLSRAWGFITDEAAYAEALATQDPEKVAEAKHAPRPRTRIIFHLEGVLRPACHLGLACWGEQYVLADLTQGSSRAPMSRTEFAPNHHCLLIVVEMSRS